MTTIHDIARKSGYSISTVSRVLNNKRHVSKEARKVIQEIIDELDYVPSDIARDLSRGKTLNIGLVLPHLKHPFFSEILRGAINASFLTEYHLVILPSEYDEERERQYLEQLKSNAFDGLIFTSHGLPLEELASYRKYGPIICCENPYEVAISAVYPERKTALKNAFGWLKQQNYQHIGFFLSRDEKASSTSRENMAAYKKVFNQKPANELIKTGITTYEDGYQAAKEWHQQNTLVDAIFSNGDDVVAGARQFYLDNQLELPFLVGQENQLSSQLINISTINYQFSEIGRQAFELILKDNEVKHIPIDSEFILRNSKN